MTRTIFETSALILRESPSSMRRIMGNMFIYSELSGTHEFVNRRRTRHDDAHFHDPTS